MRRDAAWNPGRRRAEAALWRAAKAEGGCCRHIHQHNKTDNCIDWPRFNANFSV